ncbi:T-complex protein 11-like protein 1 [Lepeophtheirus salmonis]|uniref:T-complex protein 11-like protein 1 n=1 Tax=Lepeophtheirus salmonis TaxID=72036 RepID=A0A0K2TJ81_LEPSM|nr:T-complex protein 11-like protein 1 [Lepeophtheirus salmonis]
MSTPVQTKGKKRRRTRSGQSSSPSPNGLKGFIVPGFNSSGAHSKMSLNELMDTARGVTNMVLAHEIAVNKDFKLEDFKGEASPLEKSVKEMIHKAFWDSLKDELKEKPPIFKGALSVFGEAKEIILRLLILPQHQRLQSDIKEKLDLELIKQQAEHGVLDVESYAQYVLELMAKLCAPIRDEQIAELNKRTDIVHLLKGIMETLDMMNLDMANFTLHRAKPIIIARSVEYEKEKFKEFLSKQDDGLRATREWLQRYAPSEDVTHGESPTTAQYKKLMINRVLIDAFCELLEWDDYYEVPETLVMDYKRIVSMRDSCERTAVSTAVILSAFSNIANFIVPADAQNIKMKIKKDIDVLLQDFFVDEDLTEILPRLGDQIVKIINEYLVDQKKKDPLSEDIVKMIKANLSEMEDPNHRIRDLVQKRIVEFCKRAATGSKNTQLQVPPGLTICQQQLGMIAGAFVQLISYNRSVFGETYVDLIENHVLFKEDEKENNSSSRESRPIEA